MQSKIFHFGQASSISPPSWDPQIAKWFANPQCSVCQILQNTKTWDSSTGTAPALWQKWEQFSVALLTCESGLQPQLLCKLNHILHREKGKGLSFQFFQKYHHIQGTFPLLWSQGGQSFRNYKKIQAQRSPYKFCWCIILGVLTNFPWIFCKWIGLGKIVLKICLVLLGKVKGNTSHPQDPVTSDSQRLHHKGSL